MIPSIFKHQYWVEPFSGNKRVTSESSIVSKHHHMRVTRESFIKIGLKIKYWIS